MEVANFVHVTPAPEEFSRAIRGVRWPDQSLVGTHQDGCTEPWIAQVVASLLVASGGKTVLETGAFQGTTTAWLALALQSMGGGHLIACDIDAERANAVWSRLASLPIPNVRWATFATDVLDYIRSLDTAVLDFVWLDDDHQKPHVQDEINALWPKMRGGGLIVFHDVFGSVDLQSVVRANGGYCLDLPKLGPAGGLGLIQVP